MTPNEYQKLALRTEHTPNFACDPADQRPNLGLSRLMHGMIGVCTEAGELQDMVKRFLMYGQPFDKINVLEECSDLCWYIAIALDACGYTFEQAMQSNITKLQLRYPQKFTSEQALTRDLGAERKSLEESAKP